jgi:hypothetical protein
MWLVRTTSLTHTTNLTSSTLNTLMTSPVDRGLLKSSSKPESGLLGAIVLAVQCDGIMQTIVLQAFLACSVRVQDSNETEPAIQALALRLHLFHVNFHPRCGSGMITAHFRQFLEDARSRWRSAGTCEHQFHQAVLLLKLILHKLGSHSVLPRPAHACAAVASGQQAWTQRTNACQLHQQAPAADLLTVTI